MDAIIPLCLYSNNQNSYITIPENKSITNMDLIMIFYVINPAINPFPTYADLIGIKNSDNKTDDIFRIYDPFDMDIETSIRCLIWLEPTPNTVPLYITTNGSNLYISPYQNSYTPYKIPIIHVLSASRWKTSSSGIPSFTFSNSYGKCIPDPKSNLSLEQCIAIYNKNTNKYPNILTYLQNRYGNGNRKSNNFHIIGIIFTIIFIISILVLFWLKMKKYDFIDKN